MHEDRDEPYVIAGTFFIHFISYFVLLDNGFTHSFMVSAVFRWLQIPVKDIKVVVTVQSLVENLVDVSRVYYNCPLEIQGEVFLANLMEIAFSEFNLILGERKGQSWKLLMI